ncbi:hypothetical protein TWF281_011229 [Arthrobotrys megalospora]
MSNTGSNEVGFSTVTTNKKPNPLLERFGLAEYTYRGVKTIVCKACRVICIPGHVAGHLKKRHMFTHAEIKRAGLLTNVKGRGWATEKRIGSLVGFLISNRPRPLEPFESMRGWQCRYCYQCYKTRMSLSTHISAKCSKRPPKAKHLQNPEISLESFVECQKVLGNKHGTLVRVYPRPNEKPLMAAGSKDIKFLQDRRAQKLYVTERNPASTSDPWLAMTGWLAFCGGDSQFVANTLCPLTAARGDSPTLGRIAIAAKSILHKSLSYINETASCYRRKLESPGRYRSNDLFGCQKPITQHNYIDIFVRMVLYLCRLSCQDESVIRKTEVSLKEFQDNIQLVISLAGRADEGRASDQLEKSILALVAQCLITRIPAGASSKFQHPVINFLAVEGYDEKQRKWRDARHATPYFAAMSFCARLCILAVSWENAKSPGQLVIDLEKYFGGSGGYYEDESDGEGEGEGSSAAIADRFRETFNRIIMATKDGSEYPMGEWMAQHAYGKAISDNSLLRGHIYWNGDETALFYNGERFDLLKYRGFMSEMPRKINKILRKMRFVEGSLPTIPLGDIIDNTSNSQPGYGLSNEPRNSEWANFCLLSHILQTPQLREKFYPKGSDVLSRSTMSWYLELNLELQLWFATAILLTSGAPPRGTEILTLLKYNTATQRRNIFVIDGEVMVLSMYNKTQGLTGHASPIYRFLPKSIGESLVLYLFHIEPLVDLFQYHMADAGLEVNKDPSPLLFTPFGKSYSPWTAAMISDFLKRESELAFGFPLQLSNYRQIIAAIARTHIHEMADIIDNHLELTKSKLVAQFGHSYRTNIGYYGVMDSRVPETEEISMKQFRRASMYYQFFLGAIPELPQWVFKPCVLLYPSMNGLTHPKFLHPAFPQESMTSEADRSLARRVLVDTDRNTTKLVGLQCEQDHGGGTQSIISSSAKFMVLI